MRPSEEYTIHILSDEEFDLLPVGKPKEALGMTDAKRKVAWVRQTGVKGLDMNTIHHEFDELMAGTSLHEEDGIRYKKGGNIFKILATAVATIINPALGLAIGTGSALHSNAQAEAAQKSARAQADAQQQAQQIQFQQQSAFRQPFVSASTASKPLSDVDFQTGLENITKNLNQRTTDIFRQSGFRGQKENQNTALAKALGSARTSATTERDLFIRQQEEAKRSAGQL